MKIGDEVNVFDIADSCIERAYPNIYGKEKGWWGAKRIPNWGILRGAIANAIATERENCILKNNQSGTKLT